MRYFQNKFPEYQGGADVNIDSMKWKERIETVVKSIIREMPPTRENCDGGLYVGNAGVAYMLYYLSKSGLFDESRTTHFLDKGFEYSKASMNYVQAKGFSEPPCSFLLGEAGCVVVSCLLFNEVKDVPRIDKLMKHYKSLAEHCAPINFFPNGSDEMFMGRAGYLCGAHVLQEKLNKKVIADDVIKNICTVTVKSGKEYVRRRMSSSHFKPPLMYAYYGTEYLGAAHGIAGILQMLLSFPEFVSSDAPTDKMAVADVKNTVDFMLSLQQPNHNFPPALDKVGSGRRHESQELVHWCHGAPGVVYMFARAYMVWKEEKYLKACLNCGELTWKCGLLKKGPGICHGVAGSGYVFLLLYRLTGDKKHLYRALKFAEFLFSEEFNHGARRPDSAYSLFEGWAGTVLFLVDLLQPDKAEFPLFNVVF